MASTANQNLLLQGIYKEKALTTKPQSSKRSLYYFRRSGSVLHTWSIYLLIFCFAMQLPRVNDGCLYIGQTIIATTCYQKCHNSAARLYSHLKTSPKELQNLLCKYLRYKEECTKKLEETRKDFPPNATVCWGDFDNFICWPHAKPGIVHQKCPDYIDGYNVSYGTEPAAHRFCMQNGSWHTTTKGSVTSIWDHRLDCNPIDEKENSEATDETDSEMAMLNALAITYTVGYAISLVCLVIALVIFAYFRKLHCTRNYIHINLMLSFIVRYVAVLVKDRVLQSHYDISRFKEFDDEVMKQFCDQYDGVSGFMISCRLVITLMHYGILANYFWLLAEGIYLQSLLLFAMSDYKDNKYFPVYMAFGWGAPWIFVGVWVVLRITFGNVGCWEIYESNNLWWILRAPVIVSIGINFIVFINVIRLIVSKLRAHNLNRNDYKLTLAKSTLALIPLLGIHYIVFIVITDDVVQSDDLIMKIKLGFEMVLTSIQGMLIAVFYCFLNGEVQAEVSKFWKNFRLKNGLPSSTVRKSSTYHTNGTQFTALASTNSADDRSHAMQETSLLSPNGDPHRSSSACSEYLMPPRKVHGPRVSETDPKHGEDVV